MSYGGGSRERSPALGTESVKVDVKIRSSFNVRYLVTLHFMTISFDWDRTFGRATQFNMTGIGLLAGQLSSI